MTDDERAIHQLVATWMQASERGDSDTVLGLIADDVVFMVVGREPFGAKAMQGLRIQGTSEIRELKILGGWAYARNYLRVTMTPAGGQPIQREGYTLTLFRKEPDRRWRLAREANLLPPA